MNNTLIDKIKEEKGNNASTSLNVPQLSKFINSSSKTNKISFNFSTLQNRSSIASLLSKAKSKEISNSPQLKCIVDAPDDSEPKRIGISPELAQSAPLPINKSKTNDTSQQMCNRNSFYASKTLSLKSLAPYGKCLSVSNSPRNSTGSLSFAPSSIEVSKISMIYAVKKSTSVIEYAYKEDQNRQYKEAMEDKAKSIDNFTNNKYQSLFMLFDGHGGDEVSKYLQRNFDSVYRKNLNNIITDTSIESALKNSFIEIDSQIKSLHCPSTGSTGCVVHIVRYSESSYKVYVANIGDTRCSLISPVSYQRLSYDDKASDQKEKDRVLSLGGTITNDRVNGELMLTRAFGDFDLKDKGLISEPHVISKEIDLNVKNQFLILACDGIWDVLSEDDIMQIIMFNNKESEDLARNIMKSAISKEAWDNLSIFVIKLT